LHGFGRHSEHGATIIQRLELSDDFMRQLTEFPRIMNATAFLAKKWPFDMDTQHTGHASLDGIVGGSQSFLDNLEIIADKRGQHSGGAKLAMGAGNGPDAINSGGVVEQYTTTAVDLGVDVAGQQVLAAQIYHAKVIMIESGCRSHRNNPVAANNDHVTCADPVVDQNLPINQ
jgi:hypothetical protein